MTTAVLLYLELFPVNFEDKALSEFDGTYMEVVGRVSAKEVRKDFQGDKMPVLYIVPMEIEDDGYDHSREGAAGGKFLPSGGLMVQCYLGSWETIPSIGEYVCVGGKVKCFEAPTNPGEFDSRLYYSTLKISYRLSSASVIKRGGRANDYREFLYKVRMRLEDALDAVLDEKDSAVMKAMLLGDKSFIDQETKDMYQGSGIMHILAVSGLHISIIGMGMYSLLKRISDLFYVCLSALVRRNNYSEGFFRKASRRIFRMASFSGNTIAAFLAIFFMYSYGVMCGMGSSSFRAIMMFALRLLAPIVGRTYDVLSALALAEILLVLDQPLYLYNSGFLFSFGAVLGMAAVKPVLVPARKLLGMDDNKMRFVDDKEKTNWLDGLMNSIAIVLTTLPVYACFYYTYPLHSLVLNLVVIPVMGVLMILGITCMLISVAGGYFILVGKLPGIAVHVILLFYRWLCSGTTLRRGFTWYMGHSGKWQVAGYIVLMTLFTLISWMMKDERWRGVLARLISAMDNGNVSGNTKRKNADCAIEGGNSIAGDAITDNTMYGKRTIIALDIVRTAILAIAVIILTFHTTPDLEINMIDVGQGDGIVVSVNHHHILIDGGSTSKNNVGRYQIIPFLKFKGIGKLDAVILTHEDKDHMSGILEVMDDMERGGISIGGLILPEVGEASRGENYHLLEKRASELGIDVSYINTGESFNLGNASFTCLNPDLGMVTEEANAYSTVLYMKYGKFTALFTGDMEKEGLDHVKNVLKASQDSPTDICSGDITLLKVAHHGSRYTTDEEFLSLTHPSIALISCGRDNSYGHPHQELLDRLDQAGASSLRTDVGGCISVIADNGVVSVT